MKVILCGFEWAGCRALDLLLEKKAEIFVYTHKTKSYIPSVAEYAKEKKIPFTINSINDSELPFKADYIISVYYRNIINSNILKKVNFKAMNLHPSILPSYRGCSSLTWAMINGENEVGYTYHYLDEKIDNGKIILQKKIPIFEYDTQLNLYQRVIFAGMSDFDNAFDKLIKNYKGDLQSQLNSSYYSRKIPEDGLIKMHWSKEKIKRYIRAMINPPLPYAKFKNREIKSYNEYLKVLDEDCD